MSLSQKKVLENLPIGWKNLLENHRQHIFSENVDLFDLQEVSLKKRSLSLVFKIPSLPSQEIGRRLKEIVPENLQSRIIFQPPEGYHFTIQWVPQEALKTFNLGSFIRELRKIFAENPPIRGKILFPFFGRAGLMAAFMTDIEEEILGIRKEVHRLWQERCLYFGLPVKHYDLTYMSLSRYRSGFMREEKLILRDLEVQEVFDVVLGEALLVLNDKFMMPENTKVLGRFPLGHAKITS